MTVAHENQAQRITQATATTLAEQLGQLHCAQPCLLQGDTLHRIALHAVGVPVLELNDASPALAEGWLSVALALSAEFFTPVVVLADAPLSGCTALSVNTVDELLNNHGGTLINDADWLHTRQIALTQAIENSSLNQEQRRSQTRCGTIYLGWQPALTDKNYLQLAWSSPLPLRRIRDFSARCPQITWHGPDTDGLVRDVAAQGIETTSWR